jgi:hypothetical protein
MTAQVIFYMTSIQTRGATATIASVAILLWRSKLNEKKVQKDCIFTF